jgi:hypothetical protein
MVAFATVSAKNGHASSYHITSDDVCIATKKNKDILGF